jgi:pimeloyl-ACP methyl ester carboxylesterase
MRRWRPCICPRTLATSPQTEELNQTGQLSFTSRGRSLHLLKDFFADAEQYDLPKQIAALKSKLLIVHGDNDEIVPVEEAYFAHKLNPAGIDLAIIPGADHMFTQENHRQQVAALVVDWFSEHKTKQGRGFEKETGLRDDVPV